RCGNREEARLKSTVAFAASKDSPCGSRVRGACRRRERKPFNRPSSRRRRLDICRYTCSAWFASLQGSPAPPCQELGTRFLYPTSRVRCRCPMRFWCAEATRSARWFDWTGERFSAHSFGDRRLTLFVGGAVDPVGTAGACADSPTGPPDPLVPYCG